MFSSNTTPVPPPRSKSLSHDVLEDANNVLAANRMSVFGSSTSATSIKKRKTAYQDFRILVVWLEDHEDRKNFPTNDILPTTDIGEDVSIDIDSCHILFVSPKQGGLYSINLDPSNRRLGIAHPLADGIIVSYELLKFTIRQTVLSISLRHRLEHETFIPPFVRRRQKIEEFGSKYGKSITRAEFLSDVLSA